MSILSDRLRELRGPSSQAEMARQLSMPRQQWIKYETGQSAPGAEILATICRIHACSADWLLGLERRPSPTSVNVRGDGNAVATGPNAKVSVVSTPQANCKTCPHLRKLKQLEKLLAK